jgi:hypothetical protein
MLWVHSDDASGLGLIEGLTHFDVELFMERNTNNGYHSGSI